MQQIPKLNAKTPKEPTVRMGGEYKKNKLRCGERLTKIACHIGEIEPSKYAFAWQAAFTLVELLVVMAIVSLLAAMLLPVLGRARTLARQTSCMSNLKQMWQGIDHYAEENGDLLPLIRVFNSEAYPQSVAAVFLNLNKLKGSVVTCPADKRNCDNFGPPETHMQAAWRSGPWGNRFFGSYSGNSSTHGPFPFEPNPACKRSRIRQPTRIFMLVDGYRNYISMYNQFFHLRHGSSVNFLFADSHVASLQFAFPEGLLNPSSNYLLPTFPNTSHPRYYWE